VKSKVFGAVLSVFLLAGCTTVNQAGAAATVGDSRLSVADVEALSSEIFGILEGTESEGVNDPADINRVIIRFYVLSEIAQKMADDLGVAATEDEVQAELDLQISTLGSENVLNFTAASSGVAPSFLYEYFESIVNLDKSATKLGGGDNDAGLEIAVGVLAGIADEFVSISPRYGSWNPETIDVSPLAGDAVADLELLDSFFGEQQ
jgi:hypothetical protein